MAATIPVQQETKWISFEGGAITLAGVVAFIVPPGALTTPTVIRVTLDIKADGLLFDFQPHGTVFKHPALLILPKSCWPHSTYRPAFTTCYRANQHCQWLQASFVAWRETSEAFHIQIPHFSSYYFIRRQGRKPVAIDSSSRKASGGQEQGSGGGESEQKQVGHVVSQPQPAIAGRRGANDVPNSLLTATAAATVSPSAAKSSGFDADSVSHEYPGQ
jgi:hypothetical protein